MPWPPDNNQQLVDPYDGQNVCEKYFDMFPVPLQRTREILRVGRFASYLSDFSHDSTNALMKSMVKSGGMHSFPNEYGKSCHVHLKIKNQLDF